MGYTVRGNHPSPFLGGTGQVAAADPAALIVAANPQRRSVAITNTHGTETIYWGFTSDVDASNGQPLSAGQSQSSTSQGPIYAFNAAGAVVSYVED